MKAKPGWNSGSHNMRKYFGGKAGKGKYDVMQVQDLSAQEQRQSSFEAARRF